MTPADRRNSAKAIAPFLSDMPSRFGGLTQRELFLAAVGTQRLGQAFMNSLHFDDSLRLADSPHDPFFDDDATSVMNALEFLTS